MTKADSPAGGIPFGYLYDRVTGKNTKVLWGYGRILWQKPDGRDTQEVEKELTIRL